MANKKLIEDLKLLEEGLVGRGEFRYPVRPTPIKDSVMDIASRALEEIEYLENQVREKQSALDWYDFEPGSMK